ncbi:SMP-30/gluconolactonase/LRE family protein [Glaciecola siphonariae]|uniref:SMP-30/gluconolactonase/LRE family protein n=1 Tax=Glaciecola siphonariae TaxID=521012 RepID=A0ABV9LWS7_9ALTE
MEFTCIHRVTIDDVSCELGEGPIWHPVRGSWCWFDILSNCLYEYQLFSSNVAKLSQHPLPFSASAMAVCSNGQLLVALESCLASYCLETKKFTPLKELKLAEGFRTNEGGIGPNGDFWFSSMEKKPSKPNGELFSIDSNMQLANRFSGIGIANTMVFDKVRQRYYVSDSMKQQMFVCDAQATQIVLDNVFFDASNTPFTPDGGALDSNGNLWVALWGGHRVICLSPEGQQVHEIKLPVPQPTSCCFGGPNGKHLFITSARQGLSADELKEYPLSGSSFIIELDVEGEVLPMIELNLKNAS